MRLIHYIKIQTIIVMLVLGSRVGAENCAVRYEAGAKFSQKISSPFFYFLPLLDIHIGIGHLYIGISPSRESERDHEVEDKHYHHIDKNTKEGFKKTDAVVVYKNEHPYYQAEEKNKRCSPHKIQDNSRKKRILEIVTIVAPVHYMDRDPYNTGAYRYLYHI